MGKNCRLGAAGSPLGGGGIHNIGSHELSRDTRHTLRPSRWHRTGATMGQRRHSPIRTTAKRLQAGAQEFRNRVKNIDPHSWRGKSSESLLTLFDEEVSECEALLRKLGEKIEREKIVKGKQLAEKRLNAAGHVGRWAKRRIIEKRANEVAMSEKAVKIQGAWRRKMAKDRVQHTRATCTLQAWARGWSIRRQTDAMKKEKIAAVIEIQRRSRAYLAKKAASKRLSFEDRINRRHAYRMAAISIQRVQRSRMFRRACENMSILVEAELLRRAGLNPKISGRMKKKKQERMRKKLEGLHLPTHIQPSTTTVHDGDIAPDSANAGHADTAEVGCDVNSEGKSGELQEKGDASCDDISMSMSMSMSMNMEMEMDMEKRQKREARLYKRIQRALDMTGHIYSKKIAADKAHMVRNHPVHSMPDFIPEYFNEQYGFFMKKKKMLAYAKLLQKCIPYNMEAYWAAVIMDIPRSVLKTQDDDGAKRPSCMPQYSSEASRAFQIILSSTLPHDRVGECLRQRPCRVSMEKAVHAVRRIFSRPSDSIVRDHLVSLLRSRSVEELDKIPSELVRQVHRNKIKLVSVMDMLMRQHFHQEKLERDRRMARHNPEFHAAISRQIAEETRVNWCWRKCALCSMMHFILLDDPRSRDAHSHVDISLEELRANHLAESRASSSDTDDDADAIDAMIPKRRLSSTDHNKLLFENQVNLHRKALADFANVEDKEEEDKEEEAEEAEDEE